MSKVGQGSLTRLEEVGFLPKKERRTLTVEPQRERDWRTYPSKYQSRHEHNMGGEYYYEIPRRVLHNVPKILGILTPRLFDDLAK